jgi:phosphoadenosine phosphosulfate reductase
MSPKPLDRLRGSLDANGPIWQDRAFHRDAWTTVAADAALPETPVIVGKARWLAERTQLRERNQFIGLRLEPGESLDDIQGDIAGFAIIALSFPKYSDGRAFSTATLLREKYGYRGELRAVGNVLNDQIPLMARVGFDSFEVTHAPTRAALVADRLAEVKLYYQPSVRAEAPAGTRPWLRRA